MLHSGLMVPDLAHVLLVACRAWARVGANAWGLSSSSQAELYSSMGWIWPVAVYLTSLPHKTSILPLCSAFPTLAGPCTAKHSCSLCSLSQLLNRSYFHAGQCNVACSENMLCPTSQTAQGQASQSMSGKLLPCGRWSSIFPSPLF